MSDSTYPEIMHNVKTLIIPYFTLNNDSPTIINYFENNNIAKLSNVVYRPSKPRASLFGSTIIYISRWCDNIVANNFYENLLNKKCKIVYNDPYYWDVMFYNDYLEFSNEYSKYYENEEVKPVLYPVEDENISLKVEEKDTDYEVIDEHDNEVSDEHDNEVSDEHDDEEVSDEHDDEEVSDEHDDNEDFGTKTFYCITGNPPFSIKDVKEDSESGSSYYDESEDDDVENDPDYDYEEEDTSEDAKYEYLYPIVKRIKYTIDTRSRKNKEKIPTEKRIFKENVDLSDVQIRKNKNYMHANRRKAYKNDWSRRLRTKLNSSAY
jgi:hypothetical protein